MMGRSRRDERSGGRSPDSSGRGRRLAVGVVYWAAVLAVSLALVVVLLLFFEARDASQLREGGSAPGALLDASAQVPRPSPGGLARSSRANTTIRWAALYSGWQAVSTRRS